MLDAKTLNAMLLTVLPHTGAMLLYARSNAVNRVLYAVCMCTWKSGSGKAFLTARIYFLLALNASRQLSYVVTRLLSE